MKVVYYPENYDCEERNKPSFLTKHHTYEVLEDDGKYYLIKTDKKCILQYEHHWFRGSRKDKLKRILKKQ
jgi:hypothetical protein